MMMAALQISPLKAWFDQLSSRKGLCCSFADGQAIADVDWDTKRDGEQVHYRVRLNGEWIDVPDEAVVTEPNKYGRAVVWPYKGDDGKTADSNASCPELKCSACLVARHPLPTHMANCN